MLLAQNFQKITQNFEKDKSTYQVMDIFFLNLVAETGFHTFEILLKII